jgi:predicted GNAT family acetyltransferase
MVEVMDNPEKSRFEIHLDGVRIGSLAYHRSGDVLTTPHAEIDRDYGGNGYGHMLVKESLEQIRASGLKVRPACPFVRYYIAAHPEYRDLAVA